jgi:hypothetical protein
MVQSGGSWNFQAPCRHQFERLVLSALADVLYIDVLSDDSHRVPSQQILSALHQKESSGTEGISTMADSKTRKAARNVIIERCVNLLCLFLTGDSHLFGLH